MTDQRYVSAELTHFVGRGMSEEEQYELFIQILKSGWLKCDPRNHYGMDAEEGEGASGYLLNMDHSLETGDVYQPAYQPLVVCFCDIPLEDLGIHMRKYSRFGLSFRKSFLVSKGANPVFYVSRNSKVFGNRNRETSFREGLTLYRRLFASLGEPDLKDTVLADKVQLNSFLGLFVFGFIKFFDEALPKSHSDNFYMEREWRVVGNVNFELQNVHRIILPKSYIDRFYEDLPDYRGQIHYAAGSAS